MPVLALHRWCAGLVCALWATFSQAELPTAVRQALRQADVPAQAMSAVVWRLDSPSAAPRLMHRPDEATHPASVIKLITTWAGLQLLGPEHTWRTQVLTDGPLRDGVLQGHLVLRGGGDPKLVLERAQALMAQIREAGVREVRGDIVLDRSVFDVAPPSEPFDDEPLRPYNVWPDGLLMNFRSVIYTFVPDTPAGVAQVRSEPPLAGLQAPATVPLKGGDCNDWRTGLQADFGDALRPRFAGAYPARCGERAWPLAFALPDEHAPRMVQALWQAAGGGLGGRVRWGSVPAQAKPLLTYNSLPLREVVADINKMSNNVMAQHLFLTLSSELGAPGRWSASRLRLSRWWREQFAGLPEPVLDNGSGLSRQERSTARALATLLQRAHQDPRLGPELRASLSVLGVDGTAARWGERAPGVPLTGRAWVKTGSLRDVASVAGYVRGDSGREYVVVGIVHHPKAPQARAALEHLLAWTARDAASDTRKR